MHRILFVVTLLLAGRPGLSAQTAPVDPPLRDAVECTPRAGLPNFFSKASTGEKVKIAYLGGSITAQGGWRVQSLAWFQKQFPGAKFEEVNAAIGGTGSDLGVFRMRADALNAKPDLLFVEFAVNDAYTARPVLIRAMEGIVRQTWKALPDCDICFIYTLTLRDTKTYQEGKFPRSATIMEEVAEKYGIPSIAFGPEVSRLEKEGKLVMSSPDAHIERVSGDELNQASQADKGPMLFSKDGVHPYLDTGHVLYTQALIRSMEKIKPLGKTASHSLSEPLAPDNMENAQAVILDNPALFTGEASKLDAATDPLAQKFSNRLPVLWKLSPGAILRFKFTGTKASLYGLFSPDSALIEVSLDGTSRKQKLFDSYTTYPRLGVFFIGDGLENKEHSVVITVLSEPLDKEAILPEAGKKDYREHTEKYQGANAYLGQILLVGDLITP